MIKNNQGFDGEDELEEEYPRLKYHNFQHIFHAKRQIP